MQRQKGPRCCCTPPDIIHCPYEHCLKPYRFFRQEKSSWNWSVFWGFRLHSARSYEFSADGADSTASSEFSQQAQLYGKRIIPNSSSLCPSVSKPTAYFVFFLLFLNPALFSATFHSNVDEYRFLSLSLSFSLFLCVLALHRIRPHPPTHATARTHQRTQPPAQTRTHEQTDRLIHRHKNTHKNSHVHRRTRVHTHHIHTHAHTCSFSCIFFFWGARCFSLFHHDRCISAGQVAQDEGLWLDNYSTRLDQRHIA